MHTLLNVLTKWATGKSILFLFVLLIVINIWVLPAIYPPFETFDLRSSYTADEAYNLIASYGEQGRQYYAVIELTLDLVYPIINALFFSLFTIYTFRRIFPISRLELLPVLGIVVMGADYLENICVVTMLLSYPQRMDPVAQAANLFTVTKFILSYAELILMAIGLIGLIVQKVLSLRGRNLQRHY